MEIEIIRNPVDGVKPKTLNCPKCGKVTQVNISYGRIEEYDDETGHTSMDLGDKGMYERCSVCDWIGDDIDG